MDFDDVWDHQIERDSKAGKLDALWRQAVGDTKSGKTKSLDDVIDAA